MSLNTLFCSFVFGIISQKKVCHNCQVGTLRKVFPGENKNMREVSQTAVQQSKSNYFNLLKKLNTSYFTCHCPKFFALQMSKLKLTKLFWKQNFVNNCWMFCNTQNYITNIKKIFFIKRIKTKFTKKTSLKMKIINFRLHLTGAQRPVHWVEAHLLWLSLCGRLPSRISGHRGIHVYVHGHLLH